MSGAGNTWIQEAQREGYTVVSNLPIGKYLKLEDSAYLLAYDRYTVSRGGWVLLVDHSMEKMSKSDFDYFYKLDPPDFDK